MMMSVEVTVITYVGGAFLKRSDDRDENVGFVRLEQLGEQRYEAGFPHRQLVTFALAARPQRQGATAGHLTCRLPATI